MSTTTNNPSVLLWMWNPNSTIDDSHEEEDESWEVKAFAKDTGNVTWPPRSYTCTFCRREFRSAQALGGHMNVHRRDRARLHQTQVNMKNPILSECVVFSLPNPNVVFKSSSLNHLNGNNEASKAIEYRAGLENKKKQTDSVVEGIDLELRLGCSSSGS